MQIGRLGRHMRSLGYLVCGVVFVGGILRAEVGEAATYYVAKTGRDNNSCAQAQAQSTPRLTINSGLGCLSAGDTLSIRAGTYTEAISNPPGGTSWTNAVTMAGYPGERPRLRSDNASSPVIDAVNVSSSWVILDNLILDGAGSSNNAVIFVGSHGNLTGPHHWRLTNVEIDGSNNVAHQGFVGDADYLEILNSQIHHAGRLSNAHFEHGLYLGGANIIVDHCDIHDNAGYGVHVYNGGDGTRAHDGRFSNNRIYNQVTEWGMIISSGANNRVWNNLIYNNQAGIQIDYGGDNTLVYNNTIYNNHGSNGSGISIGGVSGTIVQNNIIYNNDVNSVSGGSGTVANNNLTTNPSFVDAGAANFNLQAGSAAINTGIMIAPVTTDFARVSRPQGGSYDIGAYEYTGNRLPPPPNLRPISTK